MSEVIFFIPPVLFSIVALAFLLLWHLKVTPAWQWAAGFAQTAIGFVLSTFPIEPAFAALASGLVFIGAAYCYGSGLMAHFRVRTQRSARLAFVGTYTALLVYCVYGRQSLIDQLFLTDAGFALLLGWAVTAVWRKARRPIDVALVVTTCIVVLDSVVRTVFFTFFTSSSNDFGDFATSLYNLEVTVSTITICMFFPFTALGASATAAIERHRQAAETDELTGLLNRRGFWDALSSISANGSPRGSIILFDIDHFKRVNDTYGHPIGDRVIRILAGEIDRLISPIGQAARFGGEEFVAFLPRVSAAEANAAAELVRATFASHDWQTEGLEFNVTISCGVAESLDDADLDLAIKGADAALYSAKMAGRNRVVASRLADAA